MKKEMFKKLATMAGADFDSYAPYDNFDPEEFALLILKTCKKKPTMKREMFKKIATLAGADFNSYAPYDNFDPEEFARLIHKIFC